MAKEVFVLSASQKVLLRKILDAGEASMKRAIKAHGDRPEFQVLYDRDLAEIAAMRNGLLS